MSIEEARKLAAMWVDEREAGAGRVTTARTATSMLRELSDTPDGVGPLIRAGIRGMERKGATARPMPLEGHDLVSLLGWVRRRMAAYVFQGISLPTNLDARKPLRPLHELRGHVVDAIADDLHITMQDARALCEAAGWPYEWQQRICADQTWNLLDGTKRRHAVDVEWDNRQRYAREGWTVAEFDRDLFGVRLHASRLILEET